MALTDRHAGWRLPTTRTPVRRATCSAPIVAVRSLALVLPNPLCHLLSIPRQKRVQQFDETRNAPLLFPAGRAEQERKT